MGRSKDDNGSKDGGSKEDNGSKDVGTKPRRAVQQQRRSRQRPLVPAPACRRMMVKTTFSQPRTPWEILQT